MDSFPQIARCLEAQWRGYGPYMQNTIRASWAMATAPGGIGSMGDVEQLLWYVLTGEYQTFPIPGLKLISVKDTHSTKVLVELTKLY